jgi:flagellar assembly factor FliW
MTTSPAPSFVCGDPLRGESRVIRSPWLGEVQWEPEYELCFVLGLPGFENERRMIPVEIPAQRPMVYLQSLAHADICFVCMPVLVIQPDFELRLSEEEKEALEMEPDCMPAIGRNMLCLGLLVLAGNTVQVNLDTPVFINLDNGHGVQRVASPERGQSLNGSFRLEPDGVWIPLCS